MNLEDMKNSMSEMTSNAQGAAKMMRALGHENRLLTLCHLVEGEKTVSQIEELLNAKQAAVSQQLAILRAENLVTTRREGKAVYYSLADDRSRRILEVLYRIYCGPDAKQPA